MLSVRSYRDYPQVFRYAREVQFLGDPERRLLEDLREPDNRRRWLLARLVAKELCGRYCDQRWRFQPALHEILVLERRHGTPYLELVGGARGAVAAPLGLALSHSGEYTAAAIRPASPGHVFGVKVARIEPRYPFFPGEVYTPREEDSVRGQDQLGADATLTAYWCIKQAVRKALGQPDTAAGGHVEVLAFKPGDEARVRVSTVLLERAGLDDHAVVRVRAWYFHRHAMAFAAVWRDPDRAPGPSQRIEEDPVFPEARYDASTL